MTRSNLPLNGPERILKYPFTVVDHEENNTSWLEAELLEFHKLILTRVSCDIGRAGAEASFDFATRTYLYVALLATQLTLIIP
jgi:hypothetical protein